MKIGLVLGGGGARGLAHIGVLQILEKYNIPIDVVVGTSMGAMVGSVYAQHPSVSYVVEKFHHFLKSEHFSAASGVFTGQQKSYEPDDILQHISRQIKRRVVINLAANRQSILKGERLQTAINELVDDGSIEQTQLPFACATVDLKSGKEIIFSKGDIRQAVRASASIPGFMPPVEYNNHQLVDGSVCANFPIETARALGADFVIVSDVSANFIQEENLDNVIDIIIRSNAIATQKINKITLRSADFIIDPDVDDIVWNDFEQLDLIIEQGKIKTEENIQILKKTIKKESGIFGRFKRWIIRKLQRSMNCGYN